ncbi:MAG: HAD family hydrolase [Deltaproteobacteria bacterium]|nr:HAD family hydrolase [Deltaproteobacteria bacterium]
MAPPPLLFDLDGVLVHSYEVWRSLCRATARHFGAPPISDASFDAGWGQGLEADVLSWFPGRTPEEVSDYYDAHFLEHTGAMRYEPGGVELFEALSSRGQRSSVVTNTPQALAEGVVAGGGLRPERIVGARPGVGSKPAPDLLLLACEALGCDPASAWMIGDSRFDAEAAAAAGMRFAGFRRPGDRRLESLAEVLDLD